MATITVSDFFTGTADTYLDARAPRDNSGNVLPGAAVGDWRGFRAAVLELYQGTALGARGFDNDGGALYDYHRARPTSIDGSVINVTLRFSNKDTALDFGWHDPVTDSRIGALFGNPGFAFSAATPSFAGNSQPGGGDVHDISGFWDGLANGTLVNLRLTPTISGNNTQVKLEYALNGGGFTTIFNDAVINFILDPTKLRPFLKYQTYGNYDRSPIVSWSVTFEGSVAPALEHNPARLGVVTVTDSNGVLRPTTGGNAGRAVYERVAQAVATAKGYGEILYLNCGMSGTNTGDWATSNAGNPILDSAAERVRRAKALCGEVIVIIALSTNDAKAATATSAANVSANIATVMTKVRAKTDLGSQKIILVEPPPVSAANDAAGEFQGANALLATYRTAIQTLATGTPNTSSTSALSAQPDADRSDGIHFANSPTGADNAVAALTTPIAAVVTPYNAPPDGGEGDSGNLPPVVVSLGNISGVFGDENEPFGSLTEITPSDTEIIPTGAAQQMGLYIATGGTLHVKLASGVEVETTVDSGTYFRGKVSRVFATGTGASGIVMMERG